MKDAVTVFQIDDRAIGKYALQTGREPFPLCRAVEIVYHEETTPIKIVAKPLGLAVIELPVTNLHSIKPRPVEDFIAVNIDDLLDRTRVDAGKTADTLHELALGFIRVGTPTA